MSPIIVSYLRCAADGCTNVVRGGSKVTCNRACSKMIFVCRASCKQMVQDRRAYLHSKGSFCMTCGKTVCNRCENECCKNCGELYMLWINKKPLPRDCILSEVLRTLQGIWSYFFIVFFMLYFVKKTINFETMFFFHGEHFLLLQPINHSSQLMSWGE